MAAQSAADDTASTGMVTFAPGTTSQMIHVDIQGDRVAEADEIHRCCCPRLSAPRLPTARARARSSTMTWPLRSCRACRYRMPRGPGKLGHGQARLHRLTVEGGPGPVTVQYGTANGTASAGSDYKARSGTLTFAAGETSKTVSVAVKGDTAVEANETLTLNLSGASGATIADGSGTHDYQRRRGGPGRRDGGWLHGQRQLGRRLHRQHAGCRRRYGSEGMDRRVRRGVRHHQHLERPDRKPRWQSLRHQEHVL